MNQKLKEVKAIAEKSGVAIEEILDEMEQGYNPNLPFMVVLNFERLEQLRAVAQSMALGGLAIYQADGLDREYGGRAPQNSFVVRGENQITGKSEEMRLI